jgi:hypothetical protein
MVYQTSRREARRVAQCTPKKNNHEKTQEDRTVRKKKPRPKIEDNGQAGGILFSGGSRPSESEISEQMAGWDELFARMPKDTNHVKYENSEPRIEQRNLCDLLPFPTQAAIFGDAPDSDLPILAASIQKDGLQLPIEILPPNAAGIPENTIIKGHRRKRACLLVGMATTGALVRCDLAAASRMTIETIFIQDNFNRRQLGMLAKARCAMRLMKLEQTKPKHGIGRRNRALEQREMRDRIGQLFGMSGRHLDRYLYILRRCPIEIQEAYEAKKLTLKEATNIAGLGESTRFAISDRIRNGEKPKLVVAPYVKKKSKLHAQTGDAFQSFVTSLQTSLTDLADPAKDVWDQHAAMHLDVLLQGRVMIDTLIELAKAGKKC